MVPVRRKKRERGSVGRIGNDALVVWRPPPSQVILGARSKTHVLSNLNAQYIFMVQNHELSLGSFIWVQKLTPGHQNRSYSTTTL